MPFETVNDGDQYALGARYLVWIDTPPPWMSAHPDAWAARRTIDCFDWGKPNQRSCLYELPGPP